MALPEVLTPAMQEQPILNGEGLLELTRFEGALPKDIWALSDEQFEAWANAYARIRGDFEIPVELAAFHQGNRGSLDGKFMTKENGRLGVASKVTPGLTITEGQSYVVALRYPQDERKAVDLVVLHVPTTEEVLCFRETNKGLRVEQLYFYEGEKDGKVISRIDDGLEKGKVVLPDRYSPIKPNDGEEWVTQIVRTADNYLVGRPLVPVESWSLPLVSMREGSPRVTIRHFEGIQERPLGITQEYGFSPDSEDEGRNRELLHDLLNKLPGAEQAILARLWNIRLSGEAERIRGDEEFVGKVRKAQRRAWEVYKENRLEYDASQAYQVVDGKEILHIMQPVTIKDGSTKTFGILPSFPQPSVEAWRRYDEDFDAVVAAEAYQLATSDERFAEYLKEEEGVDLHLEAMQHARPAISPLWVGKLERTVKVSNGDSNASQDVAKAVFHRTHQVETVEICDDVFSIKLVLVPVLYAREPGKKEAGLEGWYTSETYRESGLIGSDGKVYEVEYTLVSGDVELQDRFYDLSEHIRNRISVLLDSQLSRLRESTIKTSQNGVEKVSWKRVSGKGKPGREGESS